MAFNFSKNIILSRIDIYNIIFFSLLECPTLKPLPDSLNFSILALNDTLNPLSTLVSQLTGFQERLNASLQTPPSCPSVPCPTTDPELGSHLDNLQTELQILVQQVSKDLLLNISTDIALMKSGLNHQMSNLLTEFGSLKDDSLNVSNNALNLLADHLDFFL